MIAFFRDRDPAGRSEPEGMESTSPSTNDVDVLSSSTLAVASLATPAPSLQEETPHEEVEHQYLWRCFPDYVWSQRVRDTPSWVWGFGMMLRILLVAGGGFAEKGIQNANAHLFKGHGIRAPPDKTKSAAEKKAEKLKVKDQRSIAEVMKLDTRLPREQDIANSLVKGFDRKHFQRLLLEWIIEENHAFSVYHDANITRTTIRRKVLSAYEMHKDKVVAALKQSCGLIHVSFDGWKSGNRHSLYGIACFFRDENSQPRKLALGVPELRTRHFGHNIAAEILDVLDAYGIQDKIGYFTLDNAESNDKAMEGNWWRARHCCLATNVEAFEEQLSGEAALSEAEHTLWRRKGPVGKLHNLVVDVRRWSGVPWTTNQLRSGQRKYYNPFQAYCERTRPVLGYGLVKEEATLSDDINEGTNELELWQSSWEDGDNDVRDPISYWHERKRRYPRLSRMALDFLTIQPMSAECERMFAAAGRMVTPLRNRLDADIIGMCQVLRSWLRAGVIDDLDVSLLPTENGSGAGAAGLAAAAAVHDEGRIVIVIEKEDHVGGTTFGSGGCMWMPNNLCMQELGIEDSTVQAECYISAVEKATRPALAEDTARQACEQMVEDLSDAGARDDEIFQRSGLSMNALALLESQGAGTTLAPAMTEGFYRR
ncbi:3-oxosteroid 1-dehydrogenase [Fusarium oxysporum f. sp. conglutinans]|nr:3-oxosteroid 1-dehydrogenase [Fusarium oxysporum f. sp. conglutinans]